MKKFRFSLETVKNYKENFLENLKGEYNQRLSAVREKQAEIDELEQQQQRISQDWNRKNASGISSTDMVSYQRYLHVLRGRIQQENLKLKELVRLAEEKKEEMVEAKKEVEIFLKLKEHQLEEYRKADAKAQELFAEEFAMRNVIQQGAARR